MGQLLDMTSFVVNAIDNQCSITGSECVKGILVILQCIIKFMASNVMRNVSVSFAGVLIVLFLCVMSESLLTTIWSSVLKMDHLFQWQRVLLPILTTIK